jgi:Na+/H+ antiporter NhaD/arsenite permease-like protein
MLKLTLTILLTLTPFCTYAGQAEHTPQLIDLTSSVYGLIAIIVFICAYSLVIAEEFLQLRKSKPVILAAGIIWTLVAIAYIQQGDTHTAGIMIRHNILEFAELMLFLLVAMTYINTMQDRNVFDALRGWLISHGFSYKEIFWITGLLAFFISPVADNLTTSLVMAAVVMAVAADNKKFIVIACINIVVAANAGGAFSPFGDITTLMVWQKGMLEFTSFFNLFAPSVVNWLVPAICMSFALSKEAPHKSRENVKIKEGGLITIGLFIITIALAVSFHNFLHLPPMVGMMTGLGLLKIYGYFLKLKQQIAWDIIDPNVDFDGLERPFDIFEILRRAEWDTLMFFYGIVLSVGGLGTLGYLSMISQTIYTPEFGITNANILVGVLSAIIDNIPVMFAVLTMQPVMSDGQWLLVTLTAGVGGSLLSIGSAAGVALMGQAHGTYTFFAHMKWSWAIALGYAASIWVHLLVNADLM